MPLTNGEVFFERRVKTGDFEHKHASARIVWSVPEGSGGEGSSHVSAAFDLAKLNVERILGLNSPTMATPVEPSIHPTPEPFRVIPPTPVLAPIPPSPEEQPAPPALALVGGRPRKTTKAAAVEPTPAPPALTAYVAPVEMPADDWDVAEEIPDTDLTSACGRTFQRIGDRTPIIKLILAHLPEEMRNANPPPSVVNIPQASRATFIAALDKLAKA